MPVTSPRSPSSHLQMVTPFSQTPGHGSGNITTRGRRDVGAVVPGPDVVIQGHRFQRVAVSARSPSPQVGQHHGPVKTLSWPTHRGPNSVLGNACQQLPIATVVPPAATVNIGVSAIGTQPLEQPCVPSQVVRQQLDLQSPASPRRFQPQPVNCTNIVPPTRSSSSPQRAEKSRSEEQAPLETLHVAAHPCSSPVVQDSTPAFDPLPASSRFEPLPVMQALDSEASPTCSAAAPGEHVSLSPGAKVVVGDRHLCCMDVLGSGSYSIVWRAAVLNAPDPGSSQSAGRSDGDNLQDSSHTMVALKDVHCRSRTALQQTVFEIDLLLALRKQAPSSCALRLPRCLAHAVTRCEDGWSVRSVMDILPGEQLDHWLFREAEAAANRAAAAMAAPENAGEQQVLWTLQLERGCILARTLLLQLGPTLEQLAALAWHRDVNSHNILVSGAGASFWLCDLGLATDSGAWPSEGPGSGPSARGAWRVTDIGGDCRYWPPSCWMVHCRGTEYLEARAAFCHQYQWRLDVHGLGITAIEVLCTTALAAYGCQGGPDSAESDGPWARLLCKWKQYRDKVGEWWERIYAVFSKGGDLRPVHAWLTQQQVAEKTISLLDDLHQALEACACIANPATARVLRILRELTSEASALELQEACQLLQEGEGLQQQFA